MPVSQRLRHRSTARRGFSSDHGRLARIVPIADLLTLRGARRVYAVSLTSVFGVCFFAWFLHCNPSWHSFFILFLLDVEGLSVRTRLISFRKQTGIYTQSVLINAVYRFVVTRFCGQIKIKTCVNDYY